MLTYVTTQDDLRDAVRYAVGGTVALDIETSAIDARHGDVLLVQFGTSDRVFVCDATRIAPEHMADAIETLASACLLVCHNAAFEYEWVLFHYGVRLRRIFDTMLAEQLLTCGLNADTSLAAIAARYAGMRLDKDVRASFEGHTGTFTDEQLRYAANDVIATYRCYRQQRLRLRDEGLVRTACLEFQVVPVLVDMRLAGMRLDTDAHASVVSGYRVAAERAANQLYSLLLPYWETLRDRINAETSASIDALNQQIQDALRPYGGRLTRDVPADVAEHVRALRQERQRMRPLGDLNINSGQQIVMCLAEMGVNIPNLQADTVADYAPTVPALAVYADYVKNNKIVSTYGDNLRQQVDPITGRIHPRYTQIVSTGRTASSGPNMQNMPPDIRRCFVPDSGNLFVIADFANMELRIAAGLSGDVAMLEAFERGYDLHCMTAAAANPDRYASWQDVPKDSDDRKAAKTANFAVIYGSQSVDIRLIDGIQRAYPQLWAWLQRNQQQAVNVGYTETALGRKRYYRRLGPEPRSWKLRREWLRERAAIMRQGGNHPVQGTGADIAKLALVALHTDLVLSGRGRIVNMVHDEIVVEVPEDDAQDVAALIARRMLEAGATLVPRLPIPGDVHISRYWEK